MPMVNVNTFKIPFCLFLGWYFVERSSDGQKGWVPMSHAKEIIESDHNRAKNYKKRHEFLKYLSQTLDGDQLNSA